MSCISALPVILHIFASPTAVLIYYRGEDLKEYVNAQLLTSYSLLITATYSILFKKDITRIHALLAMSLAITPLTLYLGLYAFWSARGHHGHRLESVYGRGKIWERCKVGFIFLVWIPLLLLVHHPGTLESHFRQMSCEATYKRVVFHAFSFLPSIVLDKILHSLSAEARLGFAFPFILLILTWVVAIWRRRVTIRKATAKWFYFPLAVWYVESPSRGIYTITDCMRRRTVLENYPVIRFMTVIVIPFGYWVAMIEVGSAVSDDKELELSFGQASLSPTDEIFCTYVVLDYCGICSCTIWLRGCQVVISQAVEMVY